MNYIIKELFLSFQCSFMLNQIAVPLLIVISGFICLEFFIPIAIGELMGPGRGTYKPSWKNSQ